MFADDGNVWKDDDSVGKFKKILYAKLMLMIMKAFMLHICTSSQNYSKYWGTFLKVYKRHKVYELISHHAKIDLYKKLDSKQRTIQVFNIDAQGFRKTRNENPPTWETEVTSYSMPADMSTMGRSGGTG